MQDIGVELNTREETTDRIYKMVIQEKAYESIGIGKATGCDG